jgi:hypothetical protein
MILRTKYDPLDTIDFSVRARKRLFDLDWIAFQLLIKLKDDCTIAQDHDLTTMIDHDLEHLVRTRSWGRSV